MSNSNNLIDSFNIHKICTTKQMSLSHIIRDVSNNEITCEDDLNENDQKILKSTTQEKESKKKEVKYVVVGDKGVGKTCMRIFSTESRDLAYFMSDFERLKKDIPPTKKEFFFSPFAEQEDSNKKRMKQLIKQKKRQNRYNRK